MVVINFTQNIKSKLLFGRTNAEHTWKTNERQRNHKSPSIKSKIISNYCFDLTQMAVNLYCTHNAMSDVRFSLTTMSRISKSPIVFTKSMLLFLFCRKWNKFVATILNCTHTTMSELLSDYTSMSDIAKNCMVAKTPESWICVYSINLLFHLVKTAAFLDLDRK